AITTSGTTPADDKTFWSLGFPLVASPFGVDALAARIGTSPLNTYISFWLLSVPFMPAIAAFASAPVAILMLIFCRSLPMVFVATRLNPDGVTVVGAPDDPRALSK